MTADEHGENTVTPSSPEKILELASTGDLEGLQRLTSCATTSSLRDIVASAVDKYSSSPLHYAAGNGHVEVCTWLLTLHPSLIDATSTNNGRTPLHWAARNGQTQTCQLLVERGGAIVDHPGKGQVTPLQLSIWQGHLSTSQALVELGADPSYINSWGCGTSHWVGKCPIYQQLQEKRQQRGEDLVDVADTVDSRNVCGGEALKIVEEQLFQFCHWLFQTCHVPYNISNHHGQTPLHKAAYAGNLPVIKYLVYTCCMVDDRRDEQGNLATDCAEKTGSYESSQWLRRHASSILIKAMDHLFGDSAFPPSSTSGADAHSATVPRPSSMPQLRQIQQRYYHLARLYYPDNAVSAGSNAADKVPSRDPYAKGPQQEQQQCRKWNEICDAYRLLKDWWESPDLYDVQVRILSRNATLQEHLQILWTPEWHKRLHEQQIEQHRIKKKNVRCIHYPATNGTNHMGNNGTSMDDGQVPALGDADIRDFERRLIRLLSQQQDRPCDYVRQKHSIDSLEECRGRRIAMAQLRKEYEKNWHTPLPKPQDFGCRSKKMVHFIQRYCPNIQVEYSPDCKQHAWLRLRTAG